MNQLCGKYVNVVLAIEIGEGLDFLLNPIKIIANFNGKPLESDSVDPGNIPVFKTELVWETEKKELRRLRSGSTPLRVELQSVDRNNRKERVGFCLLSVRCASIISQDSELPIEFKWQKLLGVSPEFKAFHPALYLSLTIRDSISQDLNESTPYLLDVAIEEEGEVIEELDEEENKKFPIQYIQDGFVKIGHNECDETFLLNITVQVAYNLDLLLPEILIFNQSREKYYISFKIFGIVIKSKPFYRDLHANIQMNEKIGVRIRSHFNTLKTYFNEYCKVTISFYSGRDKLGTTQLFARELLNNLSEDVFLARKGIARCEQKCVFKFPSPNGIVPAGNDLRQPFIEVESILRKGDPNSDAVSAALSIPSSESLRSLDSVLEVAEESPRSVVGEDKDDEQYGNKEDLLEIHMNVDHGDDEEESSDDEAALTYRRVDECGDGLDRNLKKVEEEQVEEQQLEEQVDEQQVDEQQVEEPQVEEQQEEEQVEDKVKEQVEEQQMEERQAEEQQVEDQQVEEMQVAEDEVEELEEEQVENYGFTSQIQSEPNLSLEKRDDDDTSRSTGNLTFIKPVIIPNRLEEIPKNKTAIYQQYCLDIVVETITLKKQLKSKMIFLKLKHPKASTFIMISTEIDNHIGEETILENVRGKMYFISTPEQIRKMVYAWPAKLLLLNEHQAALTEELDIYTAMFLAKDRNESSYMTECKSIRTYEPLAKLSIIMYLQEYGLAALPQPSQCDLLPPILDEEISIKELRELQNWKEIQKAHFMADLKITEKKQLLALQTKWAEKKKELETKLTKSVTRCQTLSQDLQTAVNNIRTKNALQLKESEMNSQRPFNENLQDNVQKYCDFKNKELIETISKLERENQQLNEVISDLRQEIHQIKKTALTKEQTTNLLHQLKGLEEKFEDAQQTKIYFKDQWQKAVKEIHDLRFEEQKEMQEKIYNSKIELDELSLDPEISVKRNFDQRAYGLHSGSTHFEDYNVDYLPRSTSTLFKKM